MSSNTSVLTDKLEPRIERSLCEVLLRPLKLREPVSEVQSSQRYSTKRDCTRYNSYDTDPTIKTYTSIIEGGTKKSK